MECVSLVLCFLERAIEAEPFLHASEGAKASDAVRCSQVARS